MFCLFDSEFYWVVQDGLKQSSCFSLPSAGNTGVCHHARLKLPSPYCLYLTTFPLVVITLICYKSNGGHVSMAGTDSAIDCPIEKEGSSASRDWVQSGLCPASRDSSPKVHPEFRAPRRARLKAASRERCIFTSLSSLALSRSLTLFSSILYLLY